MQNARQKTNSFVVDPQSGVLLSRRSFLLRYPLMIPDKNILQGRSWSDVVYKVDIYCQNNDSQ